jgi:Fur family transcriptional regulator, ferric uptake regulator
MAKNPPRPCNHSGTKGKITVAFKDLSRRSSRPRRIIAQSLEKFARAGKSFTAEDLLAEARCGNSGIGRATVFRSIERLVGKKLLGRIDFPDGKRRYFVCGDSDHHHHLVCTRCHRVAKFEHCLRPEIMSAIGKREHFSIEDHSLTLFGRCKACVQRAAGATRAARPAVR